MSDLSIKNMKAKSKIKNIKSEVIERKSKPIDENGYPIPRSEVCFRCQKEFYFTFVFSKQDYSLKNS